MEKNQQSLISEVLNIKKNVSDIKKDIKENKEDNKVIAELLHAIFQLLEDLHLKYDEINIPHLSIKKNSGFEICVHEIMCILYCLVN